VYKEGHMKKIIGIILVASCVLSTPLRAINFFSSAKKGARVVTKTGRKVGKKNGKNRQKSG